MENDERTNNAIEKNVSGLLQGSETLKNSWFYPIIVLVTSVYGGSVLSDVNDLKDEVSTEISNIQKEVRNELSRIQDRSLESFKLQQNVSQQVMETFKYSANFSKEKINEINASMQDIQTIIKQTKVKVTDTQERINGLSERAESYQEKLANIELLLSNKQLDKKLELAEVQILQLRSRLVETLGILDKERDLAAQLLKQLPDIKLNPDVLKKPLGVCVVTSPVHLRVNAGTGNKSLGMLTKGTRVDWLLNPDNDWIYIRHLTRIGYSWVNNLDCHKI